METKLNIQQKKDDIKISVVIPAYNSERTLPDLINSLKKLTTSPHEIIIVDDNSKDNTHKIAKESNYTVIKMQSNVGPAQARNIGIKTATGNIIAFTDADCVVEPDWIDKIKEKFYNNDLQVLMGHVKIPESTYLGDSISALGFPGGGSVGFEKIWHVDNNGLTDHITSCNFAIRKNVFEDHGYFDESFPLPGCEDPELSYRLTQRGVPIKYIKDVVVYHEPRTSFKSFARWQIVRGRGNYYFKKKIGPVSNFVKLRVWSSINIIKTYIKDKKFPLIFFLLFLSFVLQQWGFFREKIRDRR